MSRQLQSVSTIGFSPDAAHSERGGPGNSQHTADTSHSTSNTTHQRPAHISQQFIDTPCSAEQVRRLTAPDGTEQTQAEERLKSTDRNDIAREKRQSLAQAAVDSGKTPW